MCQLSPVTFHGDTIFCIDYQNQPYTPAKPIVENLGLGWASQSQKLNANKGRWGITIIVIPSESGDQQTLCLPVRKLPAYLASINPKKVREELRPKIELYQAESDDALWNYWMNGRAKRPVIENGSITPAHRSELKAIVDAKLSTYPASVQGKARSEIWTRFNRNFKIAEYAQLPAKRMAEARDYLIELEVKALKKLPAADAYALPKALPASMPLRAPLLSLSPDDLAALDRAAQRVEELNRHVMKEIGELHVEILGRVDLRRVQFPAWEVMSEFIFYSLFRAAELPSSNLEREKNPALALKMLAGALGNR